MTEELFELGLVFDEPALAPPTGNAQRFGGRWRLVGAGLSDVWRYGNLELPARSGRLLMRGPNGTGKTTALEALWPYLLDLDAAKLGAGKARFTSLKLLMGEGATSKRRYGYVWLTFARPEHGPVDAADPPVVSYGARLQYHEGGSPAVKVIPFRVPGRPLADVPLRAEDRSAFELERFGEILAECGGQVFNDHDAYVAHLATHIWGTTRQELLTLAGRLRAVRNPSLLGEVSPQGAALALRASLPTVADDVILATADALAESETTRQAFARDEIAADVLAEFARVWAGHAVDVVRSAHLHALEAATVVGQHQAKAKRLAAEHDHALERLDGARRQVEWWEAQRDRAADDLRALELTDAYRAAGRLADLEKQAAAERQAARADLRLLVAQVDRLKGDVESQLAALAEIRDNLDGLCAEATGAGAEPVATEAMLSWTRRARNEIRVGETTVDPGAGLTLRHDGAGLDGLGGSWRRTAAVHQTRADTVRLAVKAYEPVAQAHTGLVAARAEQDRADRAVDDHGRVVHAALKESEVAVTVLVGEIGAWAPDNADLRGRPTTDATSVADDGWDPDDADALGESTERGMVLATTEAWADLAKDLAAHRAAADEQESTLARRQGSEAQARERELRDQATALRSGALLPLPRPEWAGPIEDTLTFGAMLEWRDDHQQDQVGRDARDRVELALATSGLLGARLDDAGADLGVWQVAAIGPRPPRSLAALVTVDPAHPKAGAAQAVLQRVALRATARPSTGDDEPSFLVIGLDGTFRAGALHGDPATAWAAQQATPIPAAMHIGARQRHTAALREADRLEREAAEQRRLAEAAEEKATALAARARDTRERARRFPSRLRLSKADTALTVAQKHATKLDAAADGARRQADLSHARWTEANDLWIEQTTGLDLPADLDRLARLEHVSDEAARTLTDLAAQHGRLMPGLRRLVDQVGDEDLLAAELATLATAAVESHRIAESTTRQAEQLRANAEAEIAEATRRHREYSDAVQTAKRELAPAVSRTEASQQKVQELFTQMQIALTLLDNAQPERVATEGHLRKLLLEPAVAQTLGLAEQPATGDELLEEAERLVARRPTRTRATVAKTADDVRTALAGLWTVARADADVAELDLYVLTYRDSVFSPATAATRAVEFAERARAQLAAAEQAALTDFVVGRLPSAIGAAWLRQKDWKSEVNKKMRSTEASSGVGVQVEVNLSTTLPPAARTAFELCCRTSDADRTDTQKAEVGAALQALIAAADGENMLERLTNAVDIREWVDVHYVVTRPDRPPGRWTSRTGLSGGERRLVVLAPMLAAIAANYDRLGPTGLRLAALDEVPAEVDERGREGLARFIAELDLDLLCTSYLWDGSPGAWDGIDAHDLEAGPDGTVVAFPMLVRGLLDLPGDDPGAGPA
jgi:hypothetical protein